MTRHELRHLMGQAYGAWFWRKPGLFGFKPGAEGRAERVHHILQYRALRSRLRRGEGDDEVNARGNVVIRNEEADVAMRFRGSDRYGYDFGPCRTWVQFDTWQDASYFGLWVNPDTRETFTYCEGDRILVRCPTPETFRAELEDAALFYKATIPRPLAA